MADEAANQRDYFGEELAEVLSKIIFLAGFRARVEWHRRAENDYYINVRTRRSDGLLIGRSGETLRALQQVVQAILQHRHSRLPSIVVDVGGYKQRRENFLRKKAMAIAKIVSETGREMALDPLTDKERRLVETALDEMEGIRYYTIGTGYRKNVIIAPR
ncbi:KH domain-containing protein [candidate division WOR-3 bacterium]|nr:KH domain-containing protein [candidate division WOR-3 bacterium]